MDSTNFVNPKSNKKFSGVPAYPSSVGERRRGSAVPTGPGSPELKS